MHQAHTASTPLTPAPVYATSADLEALAGTVESVEADLESASDALDAKAPLNHSHPATSVAIANNDWRGLLMGSGVTTLQELADWLDANL